MYNNNNIIYDFLADGHIVTFDQPLYTINESDGVLPICVSLLKNIAVTVPVQVYSTDITAIGI